MQAKFVIVRRLGSPPLGAVYQEPFLFYFEKMESSLFLFSGRLQLQQATVADPFVSF